MEISALDDPVLPAHLDALYIGGGFPETHARALAENLSFRNSVKAAAQAGLPIYAECGGLMYLGEHIQVGSDKFPMAGVFPYDFVMGKKPQGHGYTILEVARDNPYFARGTVLKGHEFHYSRIVPDPAPDAAMAFQGHPGHRYGRAAGRPPLPERPGDLHPPPRPGVPPVGEGPGAPGSGVPRRP